MRMWLKMKARSYQANIIPMTERNKRRKQRIFFLASDRFSIFFLPYCVLCVLLLYIPLVNNKSIERQSVRFFHCQAHLFPSCLCNGGECVNVWECVTMSVYEWIRCARVCSPIECVCVCLFHLSIGSVSGATIVWFFTSYISYCYEFIRNVNTHIVYVPT